MLKLFHTSNGLTYLAIFSGLAAFFSAPYSGGLSAGFLSLAGLFDLLDGKFAGLFSRSGEQKEFGVELDSLADAINFGPVIIGSLYLSYSSLSISIPFFFLSGLYLLCLTARLAKYNVQNHPGEKGFRGMPSTINALLFSWILFIPTPTPLIFIALALSGILMISPFKISRPTTVSILALISLFLASALYQFFHAFSI